MKKNILLVLLFYGFRVSADIVVTIPESPISVFPDTEHGIGGVEYLDINNDNVNDFVFSSGWAVFDIAGLPFVIKGQRNQFLADSLRLASGMEIGPSCGTWDQEWMESYASYPSLVIHQSYDGVCPAKGEFLDQRGYVGVQFTADDGTHYGWIDVAGGVAGAYDEMAYGVVYSWAYEDTPDAPIVAGVIPEPSSVMLLLVGAGGLWMARQKRFR